MWRGPAMGVTEMLRAATLMLLLGTSTGYSFRVCGNYCGPGWCAAHRPCSTRLPPPHCSGGHCAAAPCAQVQRAVAEGGGVRRLRAHRRLLRGRVLQDARHLVTRALTLTLTLTLTLALTLALALTTLAITLTLAPALTRTSCGHKTPSTGKAECNTAIIACLHACRGENVSQWLGLGVGLGLGLGSGLGLGLGFG